MTIGIGVMIVEDSEAERFFLRRAIEKIRPECSVKEFAYAEDALRYLDSQDGRRLHCIFVDINMPRMDGFAFADAFACLPAEHRGTTRLWMVSHSIDPLDREQAQAHPAINGFLSKAYQVEDLDRILPFVTSG